jgi:hypothetical protein
VGQKGLSEGVVELKTRATGERSKIAIADAVAQVAGLVDDAKAQLAPRTQHPV